MITALLELSDLYSPPNFDFNRASLLDGGGWEEGNEPSLRHIKPNDVTDKDFQNHLTSIYCFMDPSDLIFYAYAMYIIDDNKKQLAHLNGYLWALNNQLDEVLDLLEDETKVLFIEYLLLLFNKHDRHVNLTEFGNITTLIDFTSTRDEKNHKTTYIFDELQ